MKQPLFMSLEVRFFAGQNAINLKVVAFVILLWNCNFFFNVAWCNLCIVLCTSTLFYVLFTLHVYINLCIFLCTSTLFM